MIWHRPNKSGRRGPYRQASPPPARLRPGARSARWGDVSKPYRRPTSTGERIVPFHCSHRLSLEVLEDRLTPGFSLNGTFAIIPPGGGQGHETIHLHP